MPTDPDAIDAAKRRILTLVAEGQLSPSDAADQLAALDNPGSDDRVGGGNFGDSDDLDDVADIPDVIDLDRRGPVTKIKVSSTARSVVIVGDPDVREAVAQGSRYEQHYDGDTLVINSDIDWESDDGRHAFRVHHVPMGGRKIVIDGRRGFDKAKAMMRETLVVRMHPDLALHAEIAAGSLSIKNVHGPVKANVAAGSMKIDGFEGPLEVDVAAGSMKGSGRLDSGHSKVTCAMGSVKLDLDERSSVRITADASLGSIKLPGRPFKAEKGSFGMTESQETVIGAGSGRLRVESSMGSVKIGLAGDDHDDDR